MTTSFGRQRPVRAYVQPIASHQKQGINGTAAANEDCAFLTPSLAKHLLGSASQSHIADSKSTRQLYVTVEWPVDRRLKTSAARTLVIAAEERESGGNDKVVQLPPSLIPPFFDATLPVLLSVHTPVPLTLLVLQPMPPNEGEYHSSSGGLSDKSLECLRGGDGYSGDGKQPIVRLGAVIVLPTEEHDSAFHVLLAEPVAQGVVTSTTRVIISSESYCAAQADEDDAVSETSFSRSLSAALDEFDPDAFLSSTLQIPRHQDGSPNAQSQDGLKNGINGHVHPSGEEYLGASISSSEGSLTPRPGGSTERGLVSPVAQPTLLGDDADVEDDSPQGVKFRAIAAMGPGPSVTDDQVVWVGVGGLGRAGIFEGDWVVLRSAAAQAGRLAKVLVWEYLDEEAVDIPANPLLISPELYRALFPVSDVSVPEVYISPTPFGARTPSLPVAKTITLARIATTEGVDRRYEASWLKGLKRHFSPRKVKPSDAGFRSTGREATGMNLLRRGDVIALPVSPSAKPAHPTGNEDGQEGESESSDSDSDSDDEQGGRGVVRVGSRPRTSHNSIAYFIVTSLSFEPLVPVEEDFRSSWSSKARAGELGCWIDVEGDGPSGGSTKMVLVGLEKERVANRSLERSWHQLSRAPEPFSSSASTKLRDLLEAAFSPIGLLHSLQLSILVKGANGGGKTSLVQYLADQFGFSVVTVECYDVIGDTAAHLSGSLMAAAEKALAAAPSILLLKHVEALSQKNEAPNAANKTSHAVKALEDVVQALSGGRPGVTSSDHDGADRWPSILIGLTEGELEPGLAGMFKQEIELPAPNERERLHIIEECLANVDLAPDVSLKEVATQSAALQAGDIRALLRRARDITIRDAMSSNRSPLSATSAKVPNGHDPSAQPAYRPSTVGDLLRAGLPLTAASITSALAEARSAYSDAIGAPKIPNVRWEDVGGLEAVKREILETVQLPLERPDLFADGLKKRSGILLYGPPGTGKTLLAKAVATTCSLNFFSVKGPELLNMYIGESEANVRRIFQRARDASPCVIFMDELDSVAPKRGQQGDSGGVMDRIVSQLLAELDGMSSSAGGEGTAPPPQVFVMGATNRPDLLDPALLRPGRFDRLIYLSPPTTHTAQADVLRALTRKIELEVGLDMDDVAERCGLNLTGADLYAVVADAVMRAMSRKAEAVEDRIATLERERAASEASHSAPRGYAVDGDGDNEVATTAYNWPKPLTPNYYLSRMAKPEETRVQVSADDFARAVSKLRPSVSEAEMAHYERVQREFRSGA